MDWEKANNHLLRILKKYIDEENLVYLNKIDRDLLRYTSGERTMELYEAIMAWK